MARIERVAGGPRDGVRRAREQLGRRERLRKTNEVYDRCCRAGLAPGGTRHKRLLEVHARHTITALAALMHVDREVVIEALRLGGVERSV